MDKSIFRDWDDKHQSDRSAGDRKRHREKVREAIKEQIGDIVAEEAIIGRDKDKIIKVPLRGIKEFRFIYGRNEEGVGQGQGGEEVGDIIGRGAGQPGQEEKAGSQPGFDYYETEITIEELIEIMFEDLELPYQERKRLREITILRKRKPVGYRHKGIRPRLALYRTARERLKRLQQTKLSIANREREVAALCAEREELKIRMGGLAGKERDSLSSELASLEKKISAAKKKLEEFYRTKSALEGIGHSGTTIDEGRFPFNERDLRYRRLKEKPDKESNAVVILIMDVSGSMDTQKKYLARSFFFLLHSFVTTKYQNVETVFISHHTEAQEVTEEEFFHKGESGGTYMSSGMNKALEIIKQRYDPSLWNVYPFYCSDGDNFTSDDDATLQAAQRLCDISRLFGYGEIKPDANILSGTGKVDFFKNRIEGSNFRALLIKDKDDIWPAFKDFMTAEKGEKPL